MVNISIPPLSVPQAQIGPHRIGALALAALVFFEVSGGPFGSEDAVSAAGPLYAMLGFLILPLAWSVPEALITAELGTMFPEDAGYVAWVTAAFGEFCGFLEGVLSWVSSVTDNAIYPVLFLSYLETTFSLHLATWPKYFLAVAITVILTFLNYRGLEVVGRVAMAISVLILVPFILLIILGLPRVDTSLWVDPTTQRLVPETIQWGVFLNTIFWNVNYFDSVSTLAGEVSNPTKNFPKGLTIALICIILTYLLPLIVGTLICVPLSPSTASVAATLPTTVSGQHCAPWSAWTDGFYGTVAGFVGGWFLRGLLIFASGFSNIGQFEAEMSSSAFQLLGMAQRGMLPAVFCRRSRHGTPILGILLSAVGISLMAFQSFQDVITFLNLLYIVAAMLEFAAFLYLRWKLPGMARPFKVPLPLGALALMLIPSVGLMLLLFFVSGLPAVIAVFVMFVLTCLLYFLIVYLRRTRPEWFILDEVHLNVGLLGKGGLSSPLTPGVTLALQPPTPAPEASPLLVGQHHLAKLGTEQDFGAMLTPFGGFSKVPTDVDTAVDTTPFDPNGESSCDSDECSSDELPVQGVKTYGAIDTNFLAPPKQDFE
eukprot:TRINITY_DN103058_c0_g1_i1.p1 TRINITY_DN103058_c0_g1~~TRINITY_DN103058_c0_g1_i1.p1  ORF type:complete len:598 (-),score=30.08 TRINITY_DN103058_c0_g1_i1:812-2605(-)